MAVDPGFFLAVRAGAYDRLACRLDYCNGEDAASRPPIQMVQRAPRT
jgi:hypothetical protein